ncbi:MAG: hypothetical protein AAF583_00530 [Pseudomonadota bacterium]
MNVVKSIKESGLNEHVIGTDPPMRQNLPETWRRRIHAFAGRSISDTALTAEQAMRSGLLRVYGHSLAHGTVEGLELTAERGAIGQVVDDAFVQISPGFGLAHGGEDVSLGRTVRLSLGAVPVIAPVESGTSRPSESEEPEFAKSSLRPVLPRQVSGTFRRFVASAESESAPRLGVIIAQPITAELIGRESGDCPPDARDDPFVDLQRIDGIRLAIYIWPAEVSALDDGPSYSVPASGPAWRNRVANTIFAVESLQSPEDCHPWEEWGLPIAVAGFNQNWELDFVDRHAVVRQGGGPRQRRFAGIIGGDTRLWQARIDQFAAQLSQEKSLAPEDLQQRFERLPPVGLLPAAMFDPLLRRQHFFSGSFDVAAAPVPLSGLDLALEQAAGLAPLDRGDPDQVELLVPVPDNMYDADLLQIEQPDARFGPAIQALREERTNSLIRRQLTRQRYDRLVETITGSPQGWPESDLPLEENSPSPHVQTPVEVTRTRRFAELSAKRSHELLKANASLRISSGDTVWAWVRVHDAAKLSGLSVRLGIQREGANSSEFQHGVYWGVADVLPISAEPENLSNRRVGDLPEEGIWVRLEASADKTWSSSGASLAGAVINSVEFAQRGGDVEWASFGTRDSTGRIYTYVADDAPAGSSFAIDGKQAEWPWKVVDGRETLSVPDFGTVKTGHVRNTSVIEAFRERWPQSFLRTDMDSIDEHGIKRFLDSVDSRLKATNDAIDVGFVRARADIYRVRQIMLGADAASRLVTSPALADLAKRDEGARATSEKISNYLREAVTRGTDGEAFNIGGRRDQASAKKSGGSSPPPAPPSSGKTRRRPVRISQAQAFDAQMMTLNFKSMRRISAAPPPPAINSRVFAKAAVSPLAFVKTQPSRPQKVVRQKQTARRRAKLANVAASKRTIPVARSFASRTSHVPIRSLAAYDVAVNRNRFKRLDIQRQLPVAGLVERTLSVAERLKPQPAVQALQYAIESKEAVLSTLEGLVRGGGGRPTGIALGDLPMAGFGKIDSKRDDGVDPGHVPTLDQLLADRGKGPKERRFANLDRMPDSQTGKHEAEYFSLAVQAIDHSIAIMRHVEGRVALFEELATSLERLRGDIAGLIDEADAFLRSLDTDIAELRHDIATAQQLRHEELTRVEEVNRRRAHVLSHHVNGVAWRRRRVADVHDELPLMPCSSGLEELPVLACRRDHPEPPDEVQEYVQLMRDVPISWFPRMEEIVERIDRLAAVRRAIEQAKMRAGIARQRPRKRRRGQRTGRRKFARRVDQALQVRTEWLQEQRSVFAQLQIDHVAQLTLTEAKAQLKMSATIGDLIEGEHRRQDVAREAVEQLDALGSTGACLYESFGEVPPIVRFAWAEMLSEFDEAVPLDSLAALPRWSEVDAPLRRNLQGFVDFLFAQIDSDSGDARDAMNEFVRICLLMAAHAPVSNIIPARLVEPAPAKVGARLALALNIARVTKGMKVLIRDKRDRIVSEAVVDEIAQERAQARVTKLTSVFASFTPSMRIELVSRLRR